MVSGPRILDADNFRPVPRGASFARSCPRRGGAFRPCGKARDVAWIKLRHEIHDDLAVVGIACELNITEDEVVGRLARVWTWFDQQTEDGQAPMTTAFIDRIARLPGFAEAMIRQSWLTCDNGIVYLPNFDRHNGSTAKARALGADRQQALRDRRNAARNAPPLRGALPEEIRGDQTRKEPRFIPPAAMPPSDGVASVEAIYAAYPRKIGRAAALKAIAKAIEAIGARGQPDPEAWLMARVQVFATSKAGNAGQYTPHPATWFNQGRFDDADAEWNRSERRNGHAPVYGQGDESSAIPEYKPKQQG